MTAYTADAATLAVTLRKLEAGDTLELTGDFGTVTFSRLAFDPPVRVSGGTIGQLTVANCSGLTFDSVRLAFTPGEKTVHFEAAFRCVQSHDITFSDGKLKGGRAVNGVDPSADKLDGTGNVKGLPAGRGMTIDSCERITIRGNDIGVFHKGIVLNKVKGFTISDNIIHELRSSPISGATVDDGTIEGNYTRDYMPWNFGGSGDHGDMIHLWTVPAYQDGPSRNITIRDNFLAQGELDALLGIYLDDNGHGLGFVGVSIENNIIANTNPQAIRLENVKGRVASNTLMRTRDGDYHDDPGVLVTDGSDIELVDNLLSRITVYDGSKASGQDRNVMVLRPDYPKVFVNGLAADPTPADLALLPGVTVGARLDEPAQPDPEPVPDPQPAPEPVPVPVEPETIEITLKAGQKLIVTGAA